MEPRRERLGTLARVTAGVVDSHLDWARRRLGDASEQRVSALVGPEARELLRRRPSEWFPFWALIEVDRAIAQAVDGDPFGVFHQLGHHSAVSNWTAPHREFDGDEPHRFFEQTALWHDVFQDFGIARYENAGLHTGRFTIEACEEYSPVFCASALGYFEGALEMLGAPGPFDGAETLCQCAGDPACLFVLSW